MKSEKYISDALSTLSMDYDKIGKRLSNPNVIDMFHAAMGMTTEAGEFLDMIKKHIFYGKDLDLTNMEEELGDSNWYQALAISAARNMGYKINAQQIADKNIAKLAARYKGKFNETGATKRDLKTERKILEKEK